jgi:hypothetical protein
MNERLPHIGRYQAMSPQERNAEIKGIFDLLPDFHGTFEHQEGIGAIGKDAGFERINNLIERIVNSDFKKDLSLRLESLLSLAPITESFKIFIIDKFDEEFEYGITRSTDTIGDKIIPSSAEFYSSLFQWDSPENAGIFDKNPKKIEGNAYKNLVCFHLSSMQMAEKMGLTQENIKEMKKDAENEGQFFEIAEQFESGEGLRKLEIAKEANYNLKKILDKDQKRKELIERWKIEFKNLYGEEPLIW